MTKIIEFLLGKDFNVAFWSNILAAVVLAFLAYMFKGVIGNFVRQLLKQAPDIELRFPNKENLLTVGPSTQAKDYDITFHFLALNKSKTPLSKEGLYLHVFIPTTLTPLSREGGNRVDQDIEWLHYKIKIEETIFSGFANLDNTNFQTRQTNPQLNEITIYYYFQSNEYGYFPKTVKIDDNFEPIRDSGGHLTIKLQP